MIPVLLILIPLVSALVGFLLKDAAARSWSLFASILVLCASLAGLSLCLQIIPHLHFRCPGWVRSGSRFAVGLDGMGQILCLLTALSFPIIFIATWNDEYKNAKNFYALMLLSQAGLMGVFLAMDALAVLFLLGTGADSRVLSLLPNGAVKNESQATFKFFVYTFLGSLLMLIGIIYIYFHTKNHCFSDEVLFMQAHTLITNETQCWLFWFILCRLRDQDAHLSFPYLAARYL